MLDLETVIAEGSRVPRRPLALVRPPAVALRAETLDDALHLHLYDQIGGFFGIDAGPVVEALHTNAQRPVVVHLNSPGGDVFAGLSIYNALRTHGAPVDVRIEGLAASIASIIALGGSRVLMAPAALFMIHDPHAIVIGDASDMRHMAGVLDKAAAIMTDVYAKKGAERGAVRQWMHEETWFSPQGALDAHLIDAIDDAPVPAAAAAARARFDLTGYKRPPSTETPAPAPVVARAPFAREHAHRLAEAARYLIGAA